jgi:hypothetical protein
MESIVTVVIVSIAASCLSLGCANKDHQKCLDDVKKYNEMLAACESKTGDEKQQCADKAAVHKMTAADCDSSFK